MTRFYLSSCYAVFKVLAGCIPASSLNKLDEVLNILSKTMVFLCVSGGKRTRTADICLAKAALYQLSYTPSFGLDSSSVAFTKKDIKSKILSL